MQYGVTGPDDKPWLASDVHSQWSLIESSVDQEAPFLQEVGTLLCWDQMESLLPDSRERIRTGLHECTRAWWAAFTLFPSLFKKWRESLRPSLEPIADLLKFGEMEYEVDRPVLDALAALESSLREGPERLDSMSSDALVALSRAIDLWNRTLKSMRPDLALQVLDGVWERSRGRQSEFFGDADPLTARLTRQIEKRRIVPVQVPTSDGKGRTFIEKNLPAVHLKLRVAAAIPGYRIPPELPDKTFWQELWTLAARCIWNHLPRSHVLLGAESSKATQTAESHSEKPAKKLSKDELVIRACKLQADHPDWSVVEVAALVGRSPKTLYRWPMFMRLRQAIQAVQLSRKLDRPTGSRDPETGKVEAWIE